MLDISATTKLINDYTIDISPVDICAYCIIKLMGISSTQTIYHISNPYVLNVKDIMNSFCVSLNEVDIDTCIDIIKSLNKPLNAHLVNDLLACEYKEVPFSSTITENALKDLGIFWPKIDNIYLSNLYQLILQI